MCLLLAGEKFNVWLQSSGSQSQGLMQVFICEFAPCWILGLLHTRKGLLTDVGAAKNRGHLHSLLFVVWVVFLRERCIELNKTVRLECVFKDITILQL